MKIKKLIASLLTFTLVVTVPERISSAEDNPTFESPAIAEGFLENNPYMKETFENIKNLKEVYNKATSARQKHNIIKNRLAIVDSELKTLDEMETSQALSAHFPSNRMSQEDLRNKIKATRFEKDFLTTLKNNTEDPWYISAMKVIFPAGIAIPCGYYGYICAFFLRNFAHNSMLSAAPIEVLAGGFLGLPIALICSFWGIKNLYKLIF